MDTPFILQAVFSGLSLGVFCLSYCFPFLAAFIVSRPGNLKENSSLILRFILGRFLGYMLFGFMFGLLGEKLQSPLLTLITNLSLIGISIVLVLYLCGIINKQKQCLARKFQNHNAIVMGFLMGINFCPPFLLSIPYILSLHSTFLGIAYFLIFFLSSSIYFLPMIFVGMLSRIKEFQITARISGFICAGIFITYGVYSIIKCMNFSH